MSYLPTRMRAAALHHTGVVGELTMLCAAMSSATELVFRCSPSGSSRLEVMSELIAKF
jgi:hypothetical protein